MWPLLGVLLYDRFTFRRIRAAHVLVPIAGACLPLGLWWLVQALSGTSATGQAAGLFSLYQQYLLFGFRSAFEPISWLAHNHPFLLPVLAAGLLWQLPRVFAFRYDPATAAVFLISPFLAFWWIFFTPGNIPRYLWYSLALGGLFVGSAVWDWVWIVFQRDRRTAVRWACAILACLACAPAAWELALQARWIYTHDDTRDLRDLAQAIETLPEDTRIGTLFWPFERSIEFLTGRTVVRIADPVAQQEDYDILIGRAWHFGDQEPDKRLIQLPK